MIFIFMIKYVFPLLFLAGLLWFVWPKAAQQIEEIEAERKPEIKKAIKMAKKNKAK